MEYLLLISLPAAFGGYLTGLLCRRTVRDNRKPSYWLAVIGGLLTSVIAALVIGQKDIFDRQRWEQGPVTIWWGVAVFSVGALAIALPVSVAVVYLMRRSFESERAGSKRTDGQPESNPRL